MSVTFNAITKAFDTINNPFTNIILGVALFGTQTTRVTKLSAPVLTRVKMPVATPTIRVAQPVTPTYTRVGR